MREPAIIRKPLRRGPRETLARLRAERDRWMQKHTALWERLVVLKRHGNRVTPNPAMPHYNCDCLNADEHGRPIADEDNDTGVYCQRQVVLADDAWAALKHLEAAALNEMNRIAAIKGAHAQWAGAVSVCEAIQRARRALSGTSGRRTSTGRRGSARPSRRAEPSPRDRSSS